MNRLSRSSRWSVLWSLLLLLACQSTAHAHMTIEGAGEIVSGALHPLMTPSHVIILLGLSLLLGQRVPLDLKTPMLVFAPVSALALVLTTIVTIKELPQAILIAIALVIAALVALEKRTSPWVCRGVCLFAAAAIGLDSAVDPGSGMSVAKTLVGTWVTMNVVLGYVTICASNGGDKQWARIAIRVLASWIVAISLLMLAFSLRKS